LATTAFVTNSPQFAGVPVAPTAAVGTNTTQLATTAFVQSVVRALHPVGSIYTATVSTNPATLFGFGTWTQFAAGRMMMGAGGSFSPGTTGGSADAVVVSHTHTASTSITDPGHAHSLGLLYFTNSGQGTSGTNNFFRDQNTGTATTGITASTSVTSSGVSGTNANLPPYIVVYMWQRTA
jgi:hypothetical protein